MHIPTHIMSGWCFGNCVPLTARERLGCMIAAVIADWDGVTILTGREEWYWATHHVYGHNLLFGLVSCAVLTLFTSRRVRGFFAFLCAFHLHLVMDYFGSGPGWAIQYWWPFSNEQCRTHWAWELTSWQNTLAAGVLLAWTILIAVVFKRTPLELIVPRLDAKWTGRSLPVTSRAA